MFTETDMMSAFPSCIWMLTVEDHETLNARLLSEIDAMQKGEWHDGGWQSPDDLHEREAFQGFAERVLSASEGVLDFLKVDYEEQYITGCWANKSHMGHAHRMHTHGNNYLSGVYYVKASPGAGDLRFIDPRLQAAVIAPSHTEATKYNSQSLTMTPVEGRMILFHSWLPHMTDPTPGDEERVSISFNIMFRGKVGSERQSASL